MSEAVILPIIILVVGLSVAGIVWITGPKYARWSRRRADITAGLFVLGALLMAYFSHTTENSMARITLKEAVLEGSLNLRAGDPIPERELGFDIEHPGVEHNLSIYPRIGSFKSAAFVARAEAELLDPDGKALIQQTLEFQLRAITNRTGFVRNVWRSHNLAFTPNGPGHYRLVIRPLVMDIPEFFIRIEDPMKTDGVRDAALR